MLAGSSPSSAVPLWIGRGSSGSMARSPSTTGGTVANVSRTGPSSRSGRRSACALGLVAEERRHHDRERAATRERGHVGDRREVQQRRPRHELVGERRAAGRSTRAAPLTRARMGRTALRRRARRPGWTANSIAVTTPKLPPPPRSAQNRSGWCSWSARTSVALGGHELERGDGVGLQPVLAGQPAHAAAKRVAGDPDVR